MMNYGFYSAEAVASGCATFFYSTPDGGEVEVVLVSPERERKDDRSAWKDLHCIGPVQKFIRKGQRNRFDFGAAEERRQSKKEYFP